MITEISIFFQLLREVVMLHELHTTISSSVFSTTFPIFSTTQHTCNLDKLFFHLSNLLPHQNYSGKISMVWIKELFSINYYFFFADVIADVFVMFRRFVVLYFDTLRSAKRNSFWPGVAYLYPLKTSENVKVFWWFRGYR